MVHPLESGLIPAFQGVVGASGVKWKLPALARGQYRRKTLWGISPRSSWPGSTKDSRLASNLTWWSLERRTMCAAVMAPG